MRGSTTKPFVDAYGNLVPGDVDTQRRRERVVAPKRTHCSVCKKPFTSYELEPGTGRCPECMP